MINTAIVFFLGLAIGYFFGQQKIKEKNQQRQANMASPPAAMPTPPIDNDKLKIVRK
jgi:hypothetical protein